MFELATVLLSLALTYTISMTAMIVIRIRTRMPGLGSWTVLFGGQAVGLFLIIFRPFLFDLLSVLIANIAIMSCLTFLQRGLAEFFGVPISRFHRIVTVVLVTTGAVCIAVFTYIRDDPSVRIVVTGLVQAAILLQCVVFCLRSRRRSVLRRSWVFVAIVAASALLFLGRTAGVVFADLDLGFPFPPEEGSVPIFLMFQMLVIALAINMLLFVHSRLVERLETANAAVARSEGKYRSLVERSPSGIFLVDKDSRITFANTMLGKMLGAPLSEIEGRRYEQFLTAGSSAMVVGFHESRVRGDANVPEVYEADVRVASGSVKTWELHVALLPGPKDAPLTLVQCQDITERKLLTQELHDHRTNLEKLVAERSRELSQAEKMASVGHIAAGLAHEISNPNNSILLNAEVLSQGCDVLTENMQILSIPTGLCVGGLALEDFITEAPAVARSIIADTRRIDRVVRSLREYALPAEAEDLVLFDLNEAVREGARLMDALVTAATDRWEQRFDRGQLPVYGQPEKVEHILVNLLQNSCAAIETRSTLIRVSTGKTQGFCFFQVEDEGCGIPEENRRLVFDPFFTTRRRTGGTGLGLSVVKRLVSEMNGDITLQSDCGRGTVVTVYIPAPETPAPENNDER